MASFIERVSPFLQQGANVLGQTMRAAPAMYAAGRAGNPAVGMQMLDRQRAMDERSASQAQEQAMMQELAGIDPMSPGGVEAAIPILMKYGRADAAFSLINQMENRRAAQISELRKAPKTRRVREGENIVDQEWDPMRGWIEVGRGPVSVPKTEVNINTPEDRTERISKMRERFRKEIGPYAEANRMYQTFNAGVNEALQGNPQGYQAAMVAFQKFLDPDSVVRESEFARTAEFQSLMDRLETMQNRLQTGGYSENLVQDMKAVADQIMAGALAPVGDIQGFYGDIARSEGYDPEFVYRGSLMQVPEGAATQESLETPAGVETREEVHAGPDFNSLPPGARAERREDGSWVVYDADGQELVWQD